MHKAISYLYHYLMFYALLLQPLHTAEDLVQLYHNLHALTVKTDLSHTPQPYEKLSFWSTTKPKCAAVSLEQFTTILNRASKTGIKLEDRSSTHFGEKLYAQKRLIHAPATIYRTCA